MKFNVNYFSKNDKKLIWNYDMFEYIIVSIGEEVEEDIQCTVKILGPIA